MPAPRQTLVLFTLFFVASIDGRTVRQIAEHRASETTTTAPKTTVTNTTGKSNHPFNVNVTFPSPVKVGEVIPLTITVSSKLNTTLQVQTEIIENTEYDIINKPMNNSGCMTSQAPNTTHTFKLRPKRTGIIKVTLGVSIKHQNTSSCTFEGFLESDYIYVDTVNTSVEAEGLRKEKISSQYVCGPDVKDGKVTLRPLQLDVPEEGAVQGSVKAWLSSAPTFTAHILSNLDSLLANGLGDVRGMKLAALSFVMLNTFGMAPFLPLDLYDHMQPGMQWQQEFRQPNGSFTTLAGKNKSSTWMTTYQFMVGGINVLDFDTFRQSTKYVGEFQAHGEKDDGCFTHSGELYDDSLRRNGVVSRPMLTAYTCVALSVSNSDGPPPLHPFKAGDCMVNDVTSDPYDLAIKAYAMATLQLPEGEELLHKLLMQATDTKSTIFWDIKDEANPSKARSKAVQVASHAVLAIMRRYASSFSTRIDKIIRWIAEQANSAGGFENFFDTMIAVRALIYYEKGYRFLDDHFYPDNRIENDTSIYNLTVGVQGQSINHTFTHSFENRYEREILSLDHLLPKLNANFTTQLANVTNLNTSNANQPTNLNFEINGNGCSLLQAVVQYNIKDDFQSEEFSLSVDISTTISNKTFSNSSTTSEQTKTITNQIKNVTSNNNSTTQEDVSQPTPSTESDCSNIRIRICTNYQAAKVESNLVAIQVGLMSGYTADKSSLDTLLASNVVAQYEEGPGKVILYLESLTQDNVCLEFSMTRNVVIEDLKPSKVFVYDFYQPKTVRSMNYSIRCDGN